ncbi:MAG TPA: hypothetical protein VHY31_02960 [Streptosporangiaceae bacterium]|nr:hypothetical protein [Streptosporangiaceae bacterium]
MPAHDPEAGRHRRLEQRGHRHPPAAVGAVVQLDNRPSAPAEHAGIPQEEGGLGTLDVADQVEVTHPGPTQDLAQREGRHRDRGLPWPSRADAGADRRGRDHEGRVAAVPGHRGVHDVDPQRPGAARQPVPEPRQ